VILLLPRNLGNPDHCWKLPSIASDLAKPCVSQRTNSKRHAAMFPTPHCKYFPQEYRRYHQSRHRPSLKPRPSYTRQKPALGPPPKRTTLMIWPIIHRTKCLSSRSLNLSLLRLFPLISGCRRFSQRIKELFRLLPRFCGFRLFRGRSWFRGCSPYLP